MGAFVGLKGTDKELGLTAQNILVSKTNDFEKVRNLNINYIYLIYLLSLPNTDIRFKIMNFLCQIYKEFEDVNKLSLEEFLQLDTFMLGIESHSAKDPSWENRHPSDYYKF